jgi:CBS domain-containing protein
MASDDRDPGEGGMGGGQGMPGEGASEAMDAGGGARRASGALNVRAADIMTGDPRAVTPRSTLADAARLMAELDVGIMPVVESAERARLVGVVTDRDLAVRGLARGKDGGAPVADCMTADVATVQPMARIREVFDLMKRERIRRVPVIDSEGLLVGIIAQADLAVHYAGLDVEREREVEEVIERISEPGGGRGHG